MTSHGVSRQNGRPGYHTSHTLQYGRSNSGERPFPSPASRCSTMPPSILKNGSNRRPRTDVTPQVRPANSDVYRMTSYKPVRSFDDAASDASFPREVSLDDDVTNRTVSKRDWIERRDADDTRSKTLTSSCCERSRCAPLAGALLFFVIPVCTVFVFSGFWLVDARKVCTFTPKPISRIACTRSS